MEWQKLLSIALFITVTNSVDESVENVIDNNVRKEFELILAKPCDPEACQYSCRCSSTDIPGGFDPKDTPQFVTLTFDGAVDVLNVETYREILYNRTNSNGCRTGATFNVKHEYTNYQLVNELYNHGFEIASHSMSHRTPQTYWANASYEDLVEEFESRLTISYFANIPEYEIKGIRLPFLQMSGNNSFKVMHKFGITYDSSWVTTNFLSPGLWPYTLDYASIQDCPIPPCPTASFPSFYVLPILAWLDLKGNPCATADGCYSPPDLNDEKAWYQFILTNFERHYFGNRAPFGFHVREAFISNNPAVKKALINFLDYVNGLSDVFMVDAASVIDWVHEPIPLDEYRQKPCKTFDEASCRPTTCQLRAKHNQNEYWMTHCLTRCPEVYPWLGDPVGQEEERNVEEIY